MTDKIWYFSVGGKTRGPFTAAGLKSLAAAGKIDESCFIWREGLTDWVPAGRVKGLFFPKIEPEEWLPPPAPATPSPEPEQGPLRLLKDTAQRVVPGKYCQTCGAGIHVAAEWCPKCGVRQPSSTYYVEESRPPSRFIAAALAFFLGNFGLHKFYEGRPGPGCAYLIATAIAFLTLPIGLGVFIGIGVTTCAWCEAGLYLVRSDQQFLQKSGYKKYVDALPHWRTPGV